MGQTKFNTTAVVTAEKLGQDGKATSNTRTGVGPPKQLAGSLLMPALSTCMLHVVAAKVQVHED